MRILFVCHRLPFPPKRGGKIRPFNIIRHLTESGHSVTVGSLARSAEELDEGRGLADHCEMVLTGRISRVGALTQMIARLPTPEPSSMGNFYSYELHRQIRAEAERRHFDLVFVHCSSAAQYARDVRATRSILDFGDMDSQKWLDYSKFRRFPLSIGYWLEGTKLATAEKKLAHAFDMCTCTTRAELATLDEIDAAQRSDWFPNGVDSEFFRPTDRPYDADEICFVGRMDYYPNQQAMLWFCGEVLPELRGYRRGLKLTIVGAEPSAQIRALARLPGVTVTGTVPDVRDYVRRAALTVAPLSIARGTQNKILESMAMGVPVVSSHLASRGVDADVDEHILVAECREDYVRHICRLLDSPDERRRLSIAGRKLAMTRHSWTNSMGRLDSIIQGLLSRAESEALPGNGECHSVDAP